MFRRLRRRNDEWNMQVFEFHFNPPSREKHALNQNKIKDGLIFDSFCYDPENMYERKAGNLYMLGLLKNTLPNNARFLDNLAEVIKNTYYKSTIFTPEKSLKVSLRKANEYLESIARKGDVSWLGNINFAALSIAQSQKGYEFNFTKIGEIKIILLRAGHLIDIDQKLKFEGIEPYPLKIFGNIISGKLIENDVILAFTKEVLDFFYEENILSDICEIQSAPIQAATDKSAIFDSEKLKDIFNKRKEELLKISGVFLAITLNKKSALKTKEKFLPQDALKFFSFPRWRSFMQKPALILQFFSKLFGLLKSKIIFSKILVKYLPSQKIENTQKIKNKRANKIIKFLSGFKKGLTSEITKNAKANKETNIKTKVSVTKPAFKLDFLELIAGRNLLLVATFIIFLLLGFFIFAQKEKQQISQYREQVNQIEEKLEKAENRLTTSRFNPRDAIQANILLKEAFEEISLLVKISPSLPKDLSSKIKALQENISDKLYETNKLKIIDKPELFFEFSGHDLAPQKMVYQNGKIYFINPLSENVFELGADAKGKMLVLDKKIALAAALDNSVIALSKVGEIYNIKDDQFSQLVSLKIPYSEFHLSDIASYYSNLYVLDNKNNALVKYSYNGNLSWSVPQIWLKNDSLSKIKSIAVDGSLWALTTEDFIEKYYAQKPAGNLKFDIYPEPKNFSKIFTSGSLPYLYISEPSQKRIIVLNKSGEIQIQIQSQSFDEILDFAVSENGKTIYILNGMKVYRISI